MKTYTTKSNAKRAAIKAIAKDRGLDVAEVKANSDKYFTIEGDKESGFYPHYKSDIVGGLSEQEEKELAAQREYDNSLKEECGFVHCPQCKIHLSNGLTTYEYQKEIAKTNGKACLIKREFMCLACNYEFGEDLSAKEKSKPIVPTMAPGTGIKIEKDRPEQNGIIRPSKGGKCWLVWDYCDGLYNEGTLPMPKTMRTWAKEHGLNENNAVIEMYQWRKFNGIIGRQKA